MTVRVDKATLPSRHVTEGPQNALHRMFYYAMGLDSDATHRPIVGLAVAWSGADPEGDLPLDVARTVEAGAVGAGVTPRTFATVAGARADDGTPRPSGASLVTRELVADSAELTMRGHSYDALLGVTACPLALAGLAMCGVRLDVPTLLVPVLDADADPRTVALALALAELGLVEQPVRLAAGAATARAVAAEAGEQLAARVAAGRTPRRELTRPALDAAAAALARAGAAPDLVVHLAALAHEAAVACPLEDLVRASGATADRAAGRAAWLTGDGLAAVAWSPDASADAPVAQRARVFDDEASAADHVRAGWAAGEAIVLRGHGPRSGPGAPEPTTLAVAIATHGHPPGALLITDGRGPVPSTIATVTAVTPEHGGDGWISRVTTGDRITLDLRAGTLVADGAGDPVAPPPRRIRPRLAKYVAAVRPLTEGAVTHAGGRGEDHLYREL